MDQAEFMRAWVRVQPMVASYIHALVRDQHVAEDLLQDVAVVLLKKLPKYDCKRPFSSWALGIARLEILSSKRRYARKLLRFQSVVLERLAESHERLAPELEDRAHALRGCLGKVEGRALEALQLRYEERLPCKKVAGHLKMSSGAVRVLLNRVRSSLKKCIEGKLSRQEQPT